MTNGEMMVPMRAAMEQVPMDVVLTTVGNSSDVTVYTTQNADVMPNFPTISRKMATVGRSATWMHRA